MHYVTVVCNRAAVISHIEYISFFFLYQNVSNVPGGTVYLLVSAENPPALPTTATPQQDVIREAEVRSNKRFKFLILFGIL